MSERGPLLLALETATQRVSVALLRGETLLVEERAPAGSSASGALLPCIDAALAAAGCRARDVEAFAVSVGPGSFTSLRIGIASVKGLAFASGSPVAPVRTLAALALAAGPGAGPVVAMLDARRGEVYAGGWRVGGGAADPVLAEGVYTPERLAELLRAGCRLVGEGALLYRERLLAGLGAGVEIVADLEVPGARHVGVLGARMLAEGRAVDVAELRPHYVRRAEAEVKRTGLRFEGV